MIQKQYKKSIQKLSLFKLRDMSGCSITLSEILKIMVMAIILMYVVIRMLFNMYISSEGKQDI